MPDLPKSFYRLALLEGATLLILLLFAVPMKYWGGQSFFVQWVGPVHGFAFLGYQYALLRLWSSGLFPRNVALRWSGASLIPFGTLFVLARRHSA